MEEPAENPCCLCGFAEDDQLKYGQLFKVDGLTVHHFCMLFSPHLAQNGKDHEGAEGFLAADIKKEIVRAGGTSCCYCGKGGATGLCMSMKCKKNYHPSCAVRTNGLLQFFGQFKSFCEEHRPRQNVIGRELGESCGICLERTDPDDDHHVLWTPCCRHFFHRSCLQRMAYHFGYFFYCPGCRNKDNVSGFLKHMRHFGIFIPKRDASWEMVPNAFGELLERHLVCDVRYCLCSQGRSHQETDTDSPWRLCVCDTCGSAGTHVACSELPETAASWVCPTCTLGPPSSAERAPKSSLREFIDGKAAEPGGATQTGEGSSSSSVPALPRLTAALSLHEVLSKLEEPEKLIRFTVNPLSGLAVQTRPVSDPRLAAREPGRRPVAFSAEELLPEAVVSVEDVSQADLRLWSEHHVAATEAGGHSSYSTVRRRAATDHPGRPLAAGDAPPHWASRVAASNAAPRPSVAELQRIQMAGLPPPAELRAALSTLQCPGCRTDFRLLSELTYHYQSHSGEPLFYCRICQQATTQWGSYHLLDHHPDLRAEEWASYVDSTFQQAQALMVRLLLHRRNIKVTPEQSQTISRNLKVILTWRGAQRGQPLAVEAAAECHSSVPAEPEMEEYVCGQCNAVLRTHGAVSAHKFFHTTEAREKYLDRPHHCSDCYFGSSQSYLVTRHRTLHHRRPQEAAPAASRGHVPAAPSPVAARPAPAAVQVPTGVPAPSPAPTRASTPAPARSPVRAPAPTPSPARNRTPVRASSPVPASSSASPDGSPLIQGLPVRIVPSLETIKAVVPESAVTATLLPSGRCKCPHCGKVCKKPIMRTHLYWHTPEAEKSQRSLAYHCPRCYFASNRGHMVLKHLMSVHKASSKAYRQLCNSCQRPMYNPERHNCLSGTVTYRPRKKSGSVSPVKRSGAILKAALTAPSKPVSIAAPVLPVAAKAPMASKRSVSSEQAPSAGGTEIVAGSLIACGNSQSRLDCPFCDAFFDSKRMYDRHLVLNHLVGAEPRRIVCRFRFCCAESSATHNKLFHKGYEDRAFRCSQCDSTYTSAEDLKVHTQRQHADESVPAFELRKDGHCWCSNLASGGALSLFKFHLIAYHSVLIRGYPGPRAAPYSCPKCPVKLEYYELIEHMTSHHSWVFSPGDEYVGSARPRSMEVGCPICHRTASFEGMFQHMREKHHWTFQESREGAKERSFTPKRRKPANSAITKAGKLVKKAAERQVAAASQASTSSALAEEKANFYDCPFCDIFYFNKADYAAHGRKSHSGLETFIPDGLIPCSARYCYCYVKSNHANLCHKNFAKRHIACDQCDGRFSSDAALQKHKSALHSVERPPQRIRGDVVCRCDHKSKVQLPSNHFSQYHFTARLPPGPRPEPYMCHECGVSMLFEPLKKHLIEEHCWKLKETGPDVFAMNAKMFRQSAPAAVSVPPWSPPARVVATIPKAVSVTAVSPVKPALTKPPIQRQLDAARAFSGRHLVSELTADPARLDCPFCDAFFLARNRYMRHMMLAHSGSNGVTDSTCTFRYCYNMSARATTEKHITTFHKGAAVLEHKCSFCDRMARSQRAVSTHAEISHKSQMQGGVQLADDAECMCDAVGSECESKSLLWMHFVHNHSVKVRSYPGPRSRPYDCPVCQAKLGFRDLVDHLKLTHMWRLKEEGEEAFGLRRLDNRNFLDSVTVQQARQAAGGPQLPPTPTVQRPAEASGSGSAARPQTSLAASRRETEAAKRSPEVSEAAAGVIACPFCDYFFDHKEEYARHASMNHSGDVQPASVCPVQYCYAKATPKHLGHLHKTLLKYHCRSCDASFREIRAMHKHIMRTHKWIVNRSNEADPLHRLCSCSVDYLAGIHMQSCHSLGIRGAPGPRDEPYLCPARDCDQKLQFAELVDHLKEVHQWKMKEHGEKLSGNKRALVPAREKSVPGSSRAPVRQPADEKLPVPTKRSLEGKRYNPEDYVTRLTFRCHYCRMEAPKDVVQRHQETAHYEIHTAFLRFSTSCTKKGMFICPFCKYNFKRKLWVFQKHLSRVAACRDQLGPVPWLAGAAAGVEARTPTVKQELADAPVKEEPMEEQELEEQQELRVAPLKIKLWSSGGGTQAGRVDAGQSGGTSAAVQAAARRPRPRPKKRPGHWEDDVKRTFYRCHFCPLRGERGKMKYHMMREHTEAYNAYVTFGKRQYSSVTRRFSCPFCVHSTDKMWLLMPHVALSDSCRRQLGPEDEVWADECPVPYGTEKGRLGKAERQPRAGAVGVDEAEQQEPDSTVPADPLDISGSDAGTAPMIPPRIKRISLPKKRKHQPYRLKKSRCHYCSLVATSSWIYRHEPKAHGSTHTAFLEWIASRTDDTGTIQCPGPSCGFSTRNRWEMRTHVSRVADCRGHLDTDAPWLESRARGEVGGDVHAAKDATPEDGDDNDVWVDVRDGSDGDDGEANGGDDADVTEGAEETPESVPPSSTADSVGDIELDGSSDVPGQAEKSADEPDQSEPVSDDPSSPDLEVLTPAGTPASSTAAAASSSVQTPQTFECLKCSSTFPEKVLLIAHSQSQHGVRRKRSQTPDKSQPRIDSFFKRAKVEKLE